MYAFANRDVVVGIKFKFRGDYVIPDENSVKYTVYGKTGEAEADLTDQAVAISSSTGSILVPASKNSITDEIEYRWVVVTWTIDGRTFQDTYSYSLIPFIPISVDAYRVRSLLGVNQTEILDEEIDPIEGYLYLESSVKGAIVAGGKASWIANEILVHQVALTFIPSLRLRVAQSVKTQNAEFARLGSINFDYLEQALIANIASLKAKLTGTDVVTVSLGVASTQTDPVTNE